MSTKNIESGLRRNDNYRNKRVEKFSERTEGKQIRRYKVGDQS